jgi:hypothetical protein
MGFKWKGALSELTGRLKDVRDKLVGDGQIQDAEVFDGSIGKIQNIVESLWDAFSDGFDLADLKVLGRATVQVVEIAEELEGKTEAEKDQFVRDSAHAIYKIWDPDIPYLWESAEDALERKAIDAATNFLLDGAKYLIRKFKPGTPFEGNDQSPAVESGEAPTENGGSAESDDGEGDPAPAEDASE